MYFGPEPAAGFGKNSHEILEYKFLALISTVDVHNRAFVYSSRDPPNPNWVVLLDALHEIEGVV